MNRVKGVRTRRLLGAVFAVLIASLTVGCTEHAPTPPGFFTIRNVPPAG
ncbi:hypothetical protein [Mycobacterium sp. TY815]|nr:hypothetical protein [Mycobacterium sp. TY815]MDP7701554.1 hypothetical protein [Mycobacterium sp. TY815]